MDCDEPKKAELIQSYLAEKLSPAEQDEFETHLLECEACALELDAQFLIQSELALRAEAIRARRHRWAFHFPWRNLALATAALLILAGSYFLLRSRFLERQLGPAGAQQTAGSGSSRMEGHTGESGVKPDLGDSTKSSYQLSGARRDPPYRAPHVGSPNHSSTAEHLPKRVSDTAAPNQNQATNSQQALGPSGADQGNLTAQAASGGEKDPGPLVNSSKSAQKETTGSRETGARGLSSAQAVEVYSLGHVSPPPFTFRGFSGGSHAANPGAISSHSRNGGADVDSNRKAFREAMTAYVEGNYKTAGDYLEEAATKEPTAADVQFYLGICRILNGHPTDALEPLQIAIKEDAPAFRQSAHYYLAKAYLQNMQLKEAEAELLIASDMSGPLKADAGALLSRLRLLLAQLGSN